jgi:rhamnulokinase
MTPGTVVAVDLGATSGRVILGQVGPNILRTQEMARFPNEPIHTSNGLHWGINGLFAAVLDGLGDAFQAEPDVASIGVDSWAVDYGLLRDGRLLAAPFHYRDERTTSGVEAVHARIPHAKLFARNGLQFLPFNTVYQLATESRPILDAADALLLIPDLIGYWLTGQARAEQTNASTTGLLRILDNRWDEPLMADLNLPFHILPPLLCPGEGVGSFLPPIRSRIGASATAAVTAVGSHDTASAVVAVPMRSEIAVYISCGTWALVGVEVEQPVLDITALEANFTNERGVDNRVRLLRNVMGLWILNETARTWQHGEPNLTLPTLLAEAAEVDPAQVSVFDVSDPRFLPLGDMPTRIAAWCAEHNIRAPHTRAEYIRSIVESLAHAFAETARTAAAVGGVDMRTIHIVGGGALNAQLCQRTADHSGVPVVAGPTEATSLGNLLVQARAAGFIVGSLDAVRDLVRRTVHTATYFPCAAPP